MANVFEDSSLGLRLKGYVLVPNTALETKIAIYTSEIVQSILSEHPEIVDHWLQDLHGEYVSKKRLCDFENDPVACFSLSVYEEFERHYKSWQDGGMISIVLPGRAIRVSKKPLVTVVTGSGYLVCARCAASFADLGEYERHCREEEGKPAKQKERRQDDVAPNPIWWFAT